MPEVPPIPLTTFEYARGAAQPGTPKSMDSVDLTSPTAKVAPLAIRAGTSGLDGAKEAGEPKQLGEVNRNIRRLTLNLE